MANTFDFSNDETKKLIKEHLDTRFDQNFDDTLAEYAHSSKLVCDNCKSTNFEILSFGYSETSAFCMCEKCKIHKYGIIARCTNCKMYSILNTSR